jgi:hypothetical protein
MSNNMADTNVSFPITRLEPGTDEYEKQKQEDDRAVIVTMDDNLIYMYCDDTAAKYRIIRKIQRLRKQGWSMSGGIASHARGESYLGFYVTMIK